MSQDRNENSSSHNPITQMLQAIEDGDARASNELFPLVYDELRRLAAAKLSNERKDHTLQSTALVHEAYLRLIGPDDDVRWKNRGHFFAAAAEAMRRILIDNARQKNADKRGGQLERVELGSVDHPAVREPQKVLELNDALNLLKQKDPIKEQLVNLRFFAGLTNKQAAEALGIAEATADRYWAYAKAWLQVEMSDADPLD